MRSYEKLADPITTADDTFDVARIERTPFTFRCFLDPVRLCCHRGTTCRLMLAVQVIHEGHGSFRPHQDLNFRQWVVCVWGYCSLSEPSLVRMAFSTYDTDQNGKLTPDELERFTKELFGHGLSYAVPTKLLEFLGKRLGDMRENGTPMPLEEFVEVAKKNTALLLPGKAALVRWCRMPSDPRLVDRPLQHTTCNCFCNEVSGEKSFGRRRPTCATATHSMRIRWSRRAGRRLQNVSLALR